MGLNFSRANTILQCFCMPKHCIRVPCRQTRSGMRDGLILQFYMLTYFCFALDCDVDVDEAPVIFFILVVIWLRSSCFVVAVWLWFSSNDSFGIYLDQNAVHVKMIQDPVLTSADCSFSVLCYSISVEWPRGAVCAHCCNRTWTNDEGARTGGDSITREF